MAGKNVRLTTDTRTIETLTVDLTEETVDPASEVEVVLFTPDGRWHRVRVSTSWFIPAARLY